MTKQEFADKASEVATKVQYTGAGTTVIFGLSLNELGVITGIIIGVLGFLTNWYYSHRAFAMKQARHEREQLEWEERRDRRSDDPEYFVPTRSLAEMEPDD